MQLDPLIVMLVQLNRFVIQIVEYHCYLNDWRWKWLELVMDIKGYIRAEAATAVSKIHVADNLMK